MLRILPWVGLWMLASLGAAVAASGCDLAAPSADQAGTGCGRAWFDANLRINEFQVVGTAESYKQRPSKLMLGLIRMGSAEDAKELDFAEPPIADSLRAARRRRARARVGADGWRCQARRVSASFPCVSPRRATSR